MTAREPNAIMSKLNLVAIKKAHPLLMKLFSWTLKDYQLEDVDYDQRRSPICHKLNLDKALSQWKALLVSLHVCG